MKARFAHKTSSKSQAISARLRQLEAKKERRLTAGGIDSLPALEEGSSKPFNVQRALAQLAPGTVPLRWSRPAL